MDLGGNGLGEVDLVALLRVLGQPGVLPKLMCLEVAANPGCMEPAFEEAYLKFKAQRQDVDCVWRMAGGQGDLEGGGRPGPPR